MSDINFVNCEKCGKRLIEKKKDGLWYFCFGKSVVSEGEIPVEIYMYGVIKIKCLRKSCHEWNTLSHFPDSISLTGK